VQKNFYGWSGLGEEARGLLVQILGIRVVITQEVSQWKFAALVSPQHEISISRLALVKRTHLTTKQYKNAENRVQRGCGILVRIDRWLGCKIQNT
jgi:hypothetical protein